MISVTSSLKTVPLHWSRLVAPCWLVAVPGGQDSHWRCACWCW